MNIWEERKANYEGLHETILEEARRQFREVEKRIDNTAPTSITKTPKAGHCSLTIGPPPESKYHYILAVEVTPDEKREEAHANAWVSGSGGKEFVASAVFSLDEPDEEKARLWVPDAVAATRKRYAQRVDLPE